MHRNDTLMKIIGGGFVPIVVDDTLSPEACAEEMLKAGLGALEVSCRHPDALGVIARLKKRFPELAVGAASLIEQGRYLDHLRRVGHNVPDIAVAAESGADFLVSMMPFRQSTYERYRSSHVMIPGVATAGEAQQALDWGAHLVKFCNPHLLGGPAFFRGMDAASHRGFPFFITGGIRAEVIADYAQVQVLVYAGGFDIILGKDYADMARNFQPGRLADALAAYVKAVAAARKQHQGHIPFDGNDAAAVAAASGRCLNEVE